MTRLRGVHKVVVVRGQRVATYEPAPTFAILPSARGTLLDPTSRPLYHRNTALIMSTRSDNHIIEPVPGVVLYKVTKSREQPKRLGPTFVHFTIQTTERGDAETKDCPRHARGRRWTKKANSAPQ